MPSLPAPLAPAFERLTSRLMATVTRVERLSPGLVSVTATPDIEGPNWLKPGTHFGVRVRGGDFRHYTIFSRTAHELGMVIDLHGGGPGSSWASSRRVGDRLQLLAPGGAMRRVGSKRALMVGDLTALATIVSFATVRADSVTAVEAHRDDIDAVRALLPAHVEAITAGEYPGTAMLDWLSETIPVLTTLDGAHLAGHAQSIQSWRQFVRKATGLGRRSVVTQAYWANERTGM